MAVKLGHRSGKGKVMLADLIVEALAVADAAGCTSDELVALIPTRTTATVLQAELEELVSRGGVVRRGVGRGALYTLDERQRARMERMAVRRADDAPLDTLVG